MEHLTSLCTAAKDSLFTVPGIVCVGAAYLTAVQLLRFRRIRSLEKQYGYHTREEMSKMTNDEAWAIHQTMMTLEFPFFTLKGLQFALFKTYGIPTISTLLVQTSELSNPQTSPKRYMDTSVLINEFVSNPPTSERALEALTRMNYLHSQYRKAGKILDDDMLYTLSLFALEPARWVDRYDWRKITDLERCAVGTFWKSIGDAMEIKYDKLPSASSGFRDGIHWLEEIDTWSREYERKCMVPDKNNHETANETVKLLLYNAPKFLHPVLWKGVIFLMEDRLRVAMIYDRPEWIYRFIFANTLALRQFVARHLLLPRPYWRRAVRHSEEGDDGSSPHSVLAWDNAPYYVKPTLWNRWGPEALYTRLLGKPVPGDDGDKYFPNGFVTSSVGPQRFLGKGEEYHGQMKKKLQAERTRQCPFMR
ncbi:hypothetical protein H112_00793 [Trichophyton rubrum D6]|uniref:Uncharacterized protein n=2 Tax=Trichophyton TaxID=5550 RepID=A0A022WEP0_TRIRU|nr:hypothetical protein H100_00792 [Trichophyton rubrum MR850]EZF46304.1 hypothetical protein H102_00782 [Trichophyton rubrum CBS 100081]EZF56875.1 hypothetical protein H103_00790 [Trichophyton rubrum CBS 288.86]EZF67507.1 hypothetical protein H104_00776 [Trichophyton rubrum CBS 289.86]EZF78169.1 hypothetical protein H105_00786 [Trichophyton soudanense CBS 452.61]EZF88827.1 hypothetical protein H110_00792 [Trichophyton rubrum MR1448]EZF99588.1 hypothetical protein H113_00792 [Trichophyton rub